MTLQRIVSEKVTCSGCYFHIEGKTKGFACKQELSKEHTKLACVEYDVANPTQLVYYIFKESCNEEQNETMAP